jgi:hypothetical protein
MSQIITSFSYDPVRSGFDSNLWRTVSGAPAVLPTGRLVFDNGTGVTGSAVHYADFVKGDVTFNVNVPTVPAGGDLRLFGVATPNETSYIRFSVGTTGTFFYAQASNGTTSTSVAVTWDSTWTAANVDFRIIWEAGRATFHINGTKVATISDDSIPYGPLSLSVSDNSTSPMSFGTINVRGTQSYILNPKTSDTSATNGGALNRFDTVTIVENVALTVV